MTFSPMAFFPANFLIQTTHDDEHQHPSFHTYQDLQGVCPNDLGKRSMSSLSGFEGGELGEANMEDELSDDGLQLLGEKKKRLNMIQVKTLEKSFEMGNKLEPERKMQLAKALGLQPRQIAIWFQNRRARWKTKQLEKDYELLKRQFDAIKQENDVLQDKNQKLHAEIMALKNRQENIESINLNKDTEGSCSNRSSTEQICDMNLNISRTSTVTVTIPPMDMDNNNNNNNSPLPNITAEDPPLVISSSRPFFPNNSSINTAHSPPHHHHFFQNFTSTTRPDFINNQKNMHLDNINVSVKEETLCNMFGFEQDHQANSSGFWPWMEQQHYN